MIIAHLSSEKDDILEYCAKLYSLLKITCGELEYLSKVVIMIITQDITSLTEIIQITPLNCEDVDFTIFFSDLFDQKNVIAKIKKAEALFDFYDTDLLIPLLNELSALNISKAMHMLALIYEAGAEGIDKDISKSINLYERASKLGYSPSTARLILPHRRAVDLKKANIVYNDLIPKLIYMSSLGEKFAAEEIARILLNVNFFKENNVKIASIELTQHDAYVMAMDYFKIAPPVLGIYGIALRYFNGEGVEEDLKKAFEYFYISATLGYSYAEFKLGESYHYGYGVDKNKEKAFYYYKRSYEHGDHDGLDMYGWCLFNHFGTKTDNKLASEIFLKGAELGLPVSTKNVGVCYETGRGFKKNITKANEYYNIAASLKKNLDKNKMVRFE